MERCDIKHSGQLRSPHRLWAGTCEAFLNKEEEISFVPIYRSAAEVERLKRKIRDYVSRYVPDVKIHYRPRQEGPFVWGEPTAFTYIDRNEITFDERILVSWPEEEIWKTVNHELAHLMTVPEYKETYPIAFPHLGPKMGHDATWERMSRILGGRTAVLRSEKIEYPKRFKLTCATCGMVFYTSGELKMDGSYWEEPKKHPLTHDFFYVEDVITRKRLKIPRTHNIAGYLFGEWRFASG